MKTRLLAVNQSDDLYEYKEEKWEKILGKQLKQVSVGANGEIWGVNSSDQIWHYLGDNNWEQITGSLKYVSVGASGEIWGVNSSDQIWHYLGDNNWEQIPGRLKQISVGASGQIWGVNSQDQIWHYLGNKNWEQIPGGLKQVSIGVNSQIWGVNSQDQIWHYLGNRSWERIPGALKHISVGADGEIWGVNASNQVWHYLGDKNWKLVPGEFKQISGGYFPKDHKEEKMLNKDKKEPVDSPSKKPRTLPSPSSKKDIKQEPPLSSGSVLTTTKPESDNWVIVRVWLPTTQGVFSTAHEAAKNGGNVGHASLETKSIYASFWPNWEGAKVGGGLGALIGEAKGALIPTPEMDAKFERRQPDVVIVLFSLNTPRMNLSFEEFKKSSVAKNWSLLGENSFNIFNEGGGQSCSGLVYNLLNSGGIQRLVSWDTVSSWWTVAPDAIARVVDKAAISEKELALSYQFALPPRVHVQARVKKPSYDLNPHINSIGYRLGEPKSQAESSGKCVVM